MQYISPLGPGTDRYSAAEAKRASKWWGGGGGSESPASKAGEHSYGKPHRYRTEGNQEELCVPIVGYGFFFFLFFLFRFARSIGLCSFYYSSFFRFEGIFMHMFATARVIPPVDSPLF